jgi:transcriptional regulator with XRE-family HTH domain
MLRRPNLGPELKRRFAERGFSMSRVAKELGLYENSLRSWIRRNRFPERELIQLTAFMGLGKTLAAVTDVYTVELTGVRRTHSRQLSQLLDKQEPSFDETAAAIEARVLDAYKGKDSSLAELQLLFRSLGEGGCYACAFFDLLPDELTVSRWAVLGKDYGSALKRGQRFIYLYPSTALAARMRSDGVTQVLDEVTVRDQIAALHKRLAAADAGFSLRELERRITMVACDNACFFSPGHSYHFFRPGRQDMGTPRLYLRAGVRSGYMVVSPLQPLSDEIADAFLSQIVSVLTEAGDSDSVNLLLA